jgi:hypothetical protein
MSMITPLATRLISAAFLLAATIHAPASKAADPNAASRATTGVTVPVEQFVSPDLLKGTGYSLQDTAVIHRSVATFTLVTPAGDTTVVGTVSLQERINEIRAVGTLEDMKKSEVYLDALKASGRGPVDTAKGLVTEPVDTVSNVAKGIGGFFADVGYSIVSNDPSQENAAKTALGFATAKRNFAYELGVNPYSTYEPLQDELGDVSWTAVGGGMTVAAGFRAVQGTTGKVLSISRTANGMRQLVRDHSPRKLQNINSDKLAAMGVSEDLIDAFLDNHKFDPETETRIVGALESMKDVEGRSDVIALASLAGSRGRAFVLRDAIELIEQYHNKVQPAKRLIVLSSAVFIVTADNKVQAVLPLDYAMSNPGVEKSTSAIVANLRRQDLAPGSVWIAGKIDPQMKAMLLAQGWTKVTENARVALSQE